MCAAAAVRAAAVLVVLHHQLPPSLLDAQYVAWLHSIGRAQYFIYSGSYHTLCAVKNEQHALGGPPRALAPPLQAAWD